MKKLTFSLLAITFLSTGLFAQGVSGGIKAGLNLADQKFSGGSLSYNPDSRIAYHVGGFLSIMFSESFGIQPELLYNSVGSKGEILGVDYTSQFDYLTLPVMFKYNPIEILNLHAGPQASYLLSAKNKTDDDSFDVKDDFKDLELGVGFGVGLDLPMGIIASLRYNVGLSDITDDDDDDTEASNNYFQLSIGYNFGK